MVITLLILAVLLFADILTKYYVEVNLVEHQIVSAIPNVLDLTLEYNTGAAWSMFSNSTLFLAILSLIASIAIIFFIVRNDWKLKKLYSISTCLLLAGTYGNMIDRFMTVFELRKGVVDMVILKPLDSLWEMITGSGFPVFNLADVFLVIGVILLAIDILFLEERRNKKNGKDSSK